MRKKIIFRLVTTFTKVLFKAVQKRDKRFKKMTDSFDAEYQFRCGKSVRRLIFNNGNIRTESNESSSFDLEINFIDMLGVAKKLKENPSDMLMLMIENLICISGNTYYLFKFGYLFSICDYHYKHNAGKFSIFSLLFRL